jgi:hypothetical protein
MKRGFPSIPNYRGSALEPVAFDGGLITFRATKLDGSAAPVVRAPGRDDERNAWVHEQYTKHPEKTAAAIMQEAETKGWHIDSHQHLLKCADAHCKLHGIDTTRRRPAT